LSNAPSVSTTFSAHADYTLDSHMLPAGRLNVGLLDPFSNATAFTALHFSIDVEGVTVEDQTFFNRAAADSDFNDNPLDFGTIVDTDRGPVEKPTNLEASPIYVAPRSSFQPGSVSDACASTNLP
jgi:hypothetical protein